MKKTALSAALGVSALSLLAAAYAPAAGPWTLVAWNDLGMHCLDSDYSVFSVLPPYNTVWAQLVDANGDLVTSDAGITVTYEAVADPTGSINKTSLGKTNYWTFANGLYGGSSVPDTGLAGNDMPGLANVPQPMTFHAAEAAWIAEGIPITPRDDAGHVRTYPMMRIVARDGGGAVLATATPVLPVSSEMDCSACHASGAGSAAEPAAGWVYEESWERDYRLNILRLHDETHLGDPAYADALAQAGFPAAGLFASVTAHAKPVLCASCHGSNALPGTGLDGISPLTSAVHAGHAEVEDPVTGMSLDDVANRASCYRCHPGSETGCLRGAMGGAVAGNGDLAMQCQSCHGNMSDVGDPARVGWLEEPSCQNCHTGTAVANNGQIRYADAFDTNGELRVAVDDTFATEDGVPAAGFSLYRFSKGHGDLACSACHGSTHAVFPATHPNDNVLATDTQGHVGTLVECAACHAGQPNTVTGGPHGMHPIGAGWVNDHGDVAEHGGQTQCRACHGTDYSGTVLSRMHADRTLEKKDGTIQLWRGSRIGCYVCHNGPTDSDPVANARPVVQDGSLTVGDAEQSVALVASDANGDPLELRVVSQPAYGRVGLVGNVATYYPDTGFAGEDAFTFAAWDGKIDSNLGEVTVQRLASWSNYGSGYPGTGGAVPALTSTAPPALGTQIRIEIENTSGQDTTLLGLAASEKAVQATGYGGLLLVEPAFVQVAPLPAAGLSLVMNVPTGASLVGATQHVQIVQLDPGAAFLLAFSRGLSLTFGL